MSWSHALSLGCILAFLTCVAIVGYCVLRDRSLRGMRISNGELRREDITISIPFIGKDWK